MVVCAASRTVFPPGTSEVTLWPFCLTVRTGPDCSCRQLLLVFYSSSVTCYLRRHLSRSSISVKSSGSNLSHVYHKYDVRLFQDNHHPPYEKIIAPYPIYITFVYRNNLKIFEPKTRILLLSKGSKIYSVSAIFLL